MRSIWGGGVNPKFDVEKHQSRLVMRVPEADGSLVFEVKNKNMVQDELIASGVLDMGVVMDEGPAVQPVELPLHTDCAYLQQPPGIQLFNCTEQAAPRAGRPLDGATKLADGLKAAEVLRRDGQPFAVGDELVQMIERNKIQVFLLSGEI